MRAFLGLLIVASISAVSAVDIPTCAQPCIEQGTNLSPCANQAQGNITACLCNDKSFADYVSNCVQLACNTTELAQAAQAAQESCAGAGTGNSTATPAATNASTSSAASKTPQGSSTASKPNSAGSTTSQSSSTSTSKPNGADSIMANIIGAATVALGAAAIAVL